MRFRFPERYPITTLLFCLFCSSLAANPHLVSVAFKTDPDSNLAQGVLLRIGLAGTAVQLFYLLSRWEVSRKWPWQRWLGEVALGGITAWTFGAVYYQIGPSTTPLGLSIAGVFGGFLGQRGLVWLWGKITQIKLALETPKGPPGGGTDAP